mgnify:FL=1
MDIIECLMSVVFPRQEHYAWHEYIAALLFWSVILTVAACMLSVIIIGVHTMSFDFIIN